MKKIIMLIVLIVMLNSCDTIEPCSEKGKEISIRVLEVGVQEAYLHFRNESPLECGEIVISREGVEIAKFPSEVVDSVIVDTGLVGGESYRYLAIEKKGDEAEEISGGTILKTMLPTSHEIEWKTYYFGNCGGSDFSDVAILDDENIWVVGEMDSCCNGKYELYNLLKWDGVSWKVEGVKTYTCYPRKVVTPFSCIELSTEKEVFISGNTSLLKWGNSEWSILAHFYDDPVDVFHSQVTSMEYLEDDEIYLGSVNDGSIYHYEKGKWDKYKGEGLEGGISDIYSYVDSKSGERRVLVGMTQVLSKSTRGIFEVNNDELTCLEWDGNLRVSSIWSKNGYPIYACGDGVYVNRGKGWKEIEGLPLLYSTSIKGNASNNIFVVGGFGYIAHYNGVDWKVVNETESFNIMEVEVKNKLVVAVGTNGVQGVVKIGKLQ